MLFLVTVVATYQGPNPCLGMLSCYPITLHVGEPNFHPPPPLHYGGIHPSCIVITARINAADIPLHGASTVIPCFTTTLQLGFSSYCFYGL